MKKHYDFSKGVKLKTIKNKHTDLIRKIADQLDSIERGETTEFHSTLETVFYVPSSNRIAICIPLSSHKEKGNGVVSAFVIDTQTDWFILRCDSVWSAIRDGLIITLGEF